MPQEDWVGWVTIFPAEPTLDEPSRAALTWKNCPFMSHPLGEAVYSCFDLLLLRSLGAKEHD